MINFRWVSWIALALSCSVVRLEGIIVRDCWLCGAYIHFEEYIDPLLPSLFYSRPVIYKKQQKML